MDKELLPDTLERLRGLRDEWRSISNSVVKMLEIYHQEDSDTPQYIDNCFAWPANVLPMSLDDWQCEVEAMIDSLNELVGPEPGTPVTKPPLPTLQEIYDFCEPLITPEGADLNNALEMIAKEYGGEVLQTGGHVYVAVLPYGDRRAVGVSDDSIGLYEIDEDGHTIEEIFYDGKELGDTSLYF